MQGLNVLSCFDGMSCGQIALERAGIVVDNYYASELDKYAIAITQKNYPNTVQLGDVKEISGDDLPPIDLLIGDSPCQGFSFAGKQLNFQDPRSALFFEYVRLLKKLKPTYFLLENVKMRKEYQDIISKHIGCSPVEIDSIDFSAQSRRRLYWTNIPISDWLSKDITLTKGGISVHAWSKSWRLDGSFDERINKTGKTNTLTCSIGGTSSINFFPDKEVDFKPRKVWNRRELYYHNIEKHQKITPQESEYLQTVPSGYTYGVSNTQRYKMLGNGWTVDVISHILKGIN